MKTSNIYIIISLFVVIVIGMIIFTFLTQRSVDSVIDVPNQDESPVVTENDYGIDRIEAKHFYIDGVHTFVGSVLMPTPCDLLETDYRVAESMPEQITLEFDVINTADTCAQVVTEQRFMIEVAASQEASIQATFMGVSVDLNLVPASEGETPEDFELFIKG